MAASFDYLIGTVPTASADRAHRDLRADAQAGENLAGELKEFAEHAKAGQAPSLFVGANGCGETVLIGWASSRENWLEMDFSGNCDSGYISSRNMLTHPHRQLPSNSEMK